MLDELIKHAMSQNSAKEFKSRAEAVDALEKFLNTERAKFTVGMYVERNEYGRSRYRWPTDNQAAIVTRVWDEMQIDNAGNPYDTQIAVALGENAIHTYLMDSRYYREAGATVRNIFGFKRK